MNLGTFLFLLMLSIVCYSLYLLFIVMKEYVKQEKKEKIRRERLKKSDVQLMEKIAFFIKHENDKKI